MSRRFFNPMFQVTRSLRESGVNAGQSGARLSEHLTHRDPRPEHKKLLREARKDPELYVLYILTAATVGAYGWYQPHFWAAITGETKVSKIEGTEPWKDGAEGSTGKYRYHARESQGCTFSFEHSHRTQRQFAQAFTRNTTNGVRRNTRSTERERSQIRRESRL
ncbi:hypothetical protein D6C92_03969 [Aureobasidium pullulans]|nr:hypothetical protein D6C92_03969 [Aureobasidium pullulans]